MKGMKMINVKVNAARRALSRPAYATAARYLLEAYDLTAAILDEARRLNEATRETHPDASPLAELGGLFFSLASQYTVGRQQVAEVLDVAIDGDRHEELETALRGNADVLAEIARGADDLRQRLAKMTGN